MEVVEHVDNPAAFLRSCAELVKVRLPAAPPACIIPSSSTRNFHLYVFLKKIRFRCLQPGGHLFLSTIARTPLSYLLTILAAEKVFRLVEPGTHTFSKFVNPDELAGFFAKPLTQGARPWISRTYAHGLPTRVEAEVRGIVYVPWRGDWVLAPRSTTLWSTQANYLFWVRRPKDIP
jgi:2-polyprenyl-6-hydroxyphenyl methylase/3-demethylubiquinone-9 3-methyltransferase